MTGLASAKPLGVRAYGSIGHLPGSRLGPGDHHCHEGQAQIATVRKRDKHDTISVTVKLDGSCAAVAKIDGEIIALMRAGYHAATSRYEQHHLFAEWIAVHRNRFSSILDNGERLVGEWLAQAHGTRYALPHEPFVPFDLMIGNKRKPSAEMRERADKGDLPTPACISYGEPFSIGAAKAALRFGHHGEIDPVEGAVWRVERNGEFDFICKWVRPDKIDGKYLPEITGCPARWNWRPAKAA